MMALEPISSAISAFMNKKFDDRTLVVGLDWPFMGGANNVTKINIRMMLPPVTRNAATAIALFTIPANGRISFPGKNIENTNVTGIAQNTANQISFAPAYLWVGTIMAPFISDLARSTGAVA